MAWGKKEKKMRGGLSVRTSTTWEHSIQMRHWMKGNEYNVGVRANREREWRETKRMKMDEDGLQKNRGRIKASMLRKTNEAERQ